MYIHVLSDEFCSNQIQIDQGNSLVRISIHEYIRPCMGLYTITIKIGTVFIMHTLFGTTLILEFLKSNCLALEKSCVTLLKNWD